MKIGWDTEWEFKYGNEMRIQVWELGEIQSENGDRVRRGWDTIKLKIDKEWDEI